MKIDNGWMVCLADTHPFSPSVASALRAAGAMDQYLILMTCCDEKQQVELLGEFPKKGLRRKALLS
jgi:hypothetical protein